MKTSAGVAGSAQGQEQDVALRRGLPFRFVKHESKGAARHAMETYAWRRVVPVGSYPLSWTRELPNGGSDALRLRTAAAGRVDLRQREDVVQIARRPPRGRSGDKSLSVRHASSSP